MDNKDILDIEKSKKIAYVKDYDKSDGVNSFYINGKSAWLDKATRTSLVNTLTIEKSAGRTKTQLWLNNEMFEVDIDDALQMLVVLELYAKDWFATLHLDSLYDAIFCYCCNDKAWCNIFNRLMVDRVYYSRVAENRVKPALLFNLDFVGAFGAEVVINLAVG